MPLEPHHTVKQFGGSRREFLELAGAAALGLVAGSGQPPQREAVPVPGKPPRAGKPEVALAQAATYERELVERRVQTLIELLGGLGDVVKPGDRVAIKINLTGGVHSGSYAHASATETFVTHPEVVRALIKQVQAAGAREIFIVEAAYEWESFRQWGYEEMAQALGVRLLDLNEPAPYTDFVQAPVGDRYFIYPSFVVNRILTEVDVCMSVSKLKNHYHAGVTHTMKNLYGLVPYRQYRLNRTDTYRSSFHGSAGEIQQRLPRIIIDLNKARPIHFSLIDGIKSIERGEGPWIAVTREIEPGVLVAGKNCVATDAVATAVMGHDPIGEYPEMPFLRCDNHLNLAAAEGLGTNHLDQILLRGVSLDAVKTQFTNY